MGGDRRGHHLQGVVEGGKIVEVGYLFDWGVGGTHVAQGGSWLGGAGPCLVGGGYTVAVVVVVVVGGEEEVQYDTTAVDVSGPIPYETVGEVDPVLGDGVPRVTGEGVDLVLVVEGTRAVVRGAVDSASTH